MFTKGNFAKLSGLVKFLKSIKQSNYARHKTYLFNFMGKSNSCRTFDGNLMQLWYRLVWSKLSFRFRTLMIKYPVIFDLYLLFFKFDNQTKKFDILIKKSEKLISSFLHNFTKFLIITFSKFIINSQNFVSVSLGFQLCSNIGQICKSELGISLYKHLYIFMSIHEHPKAWFVCRQYRVLYSTVYHLHSTLHT